jgi:carbamoyl-phosphate synthase small subunit
VLEKSADFIIAAMAVWALGINHTTAPLDMRGRFAYAMDQLEPTLRSLRDALAHKPDGIVLSNGPGDPEPCDYAIAATREFLKRQIPLYGICLGHQILGLAIGARTMKMKFGHHGANHPVIDVASGRVMISSQNHGFAVDESTLPRNAQVTHRSLFDGSNQGIRLTDAPAFSFQGHPEASPGPCDVAGLFDQFVHSMEAHAAAAA